MSSQSLDQMLENNFLPNIAKDRVYTTIDVYAAGTTALYTGKPLKPSEQPKIIPSYYCDSSSKNTWHS